MAPFLPAIDKAPATIAPAAIASYAITIRGREQPRADGLRVEAASPVESLFAALDVRDYAAIEPVIDAERVGDVAFVDVDYHGRKPERAPLLSAIIDVQPAPIASWVTHGNGMRLCYVPVGPMQADEMASLGAFWVRQNAPARCGHPSGIEIKRESRHPAYPRRNERGETELCGPVTRHGHVASVHDARIAACRLLGGVDAEAGAFDRNEVADLLERLGLAGKTKHPHSRCLIDPYTDSHGEPVTVLDRDIWCHRCKTLTPFALLLGDGRNAMFAAVKYFAHFAQAGLAIQHHTIIDWPRAMRRTLYSASLKAYH